MPIHHALGFKQHPLEDAGIYKFMHIFMHTHTRNILYLFTAFVESKQKHQENLTVDLGRPEMKIVENQQPEFTNVL